MDIARTPRRTLTMNLTSLVDIIFMLVIFFMMTTNFTASESMELSLPDRGAKASPAAEVTQIRIMATGHVTVNGVYVSTEGLNDALVMTLGKADPSTGLILLSASIWADMPVAPPAMAFSIRVRLPALGVVKVH